MNNYLIKNTVRSLIYYRKNYLILIIIISVLCSVITGSLLTGDSVRSSLNKITSEKIGNTSYIVSSGLRLFNSSLTERIISEYKLNAVSVYETEGYCQNFATGATALHTSIFGISQDFFRFHGINDLKIEPGTIGVNKKLADHLGVTEGDEIIIRFREVTPIPANAPFAPSDEGKGSLVMKVSEIIDPSDIGNFSLGINQIVPMNIYMNLHDLQPENDSIFKVNRLLVGELQSPSVPSLLKILQENITPFDIGLSIRRSEVTGESEIISDRIFIDSILVTTILNNIPEGYPVLTYLANTIESKNYETPYSFISALPQSEYLNIEKNEIIINRWLADDLGAIEGSELKISWYELSGKNLRERHDSFLVKKILETDNKLSDPMLMPDFPGISGSTSCSSWDAGVPILMNKIRTKDEDYWDKFGGTPKAFISYKTGKEFVGK